MQKRRYCNYEYAFCVEIPEKLIGLSDPSPLPQHGVGITLSQNPKSYLYVGGEYNGLEWATLDEAVEWQLNWLKEKGTDVIVQRTERTNLQNLQAMRLIVQYKSRATGEIRINDEIIAFRPYDNEKNGITYEIDLTSSASRYNEDVKVFESIVNGWRMKPVPRA